MAHELKLLETKVDDLIHQFNNPEDPELSKLITENNKLEYRLKHLNRTIQKEKLTCLNKLSIDTDIFSLNKLLKIAFKLSITESFPGVNHEPLITTANDENKFDYQVNSSLALGKQLKMKPRDVAEEIVKNLPKSINETCEKIEIGGPGFINIKFKTSIIKKKLLNAVKNNFKAPKLGSAKKLVIDYSSPNIAKDMHVGHLRSTIIGDTIANLFEYLGYKVLRLNHVGDWGTQFGMLIAHLQDSFPDYANNTPDIADLQEFYKASKKLSDSDENFKKRAYENVVKLQKYDPVINQAWKAICKVSRDNFNKIYDDLNISSELIERGESFYNKLMLELMDYLSKKNILVEDDGRKIYWPKGCQVPLTLIKSDGGYTYDTSDLACIKQRIDVEKANAIIYVVDAGQAVHFDGIFKAAQELNFYDPNLIRVQHVSFGMVLGTDRKKFKTRSGETVKLKKLLNEGKERAGEVIKDRKKEKFEELSEAEFQHIKKAVGMSAIKYSDLSTSRINDYVFSFDKMLDFKGNTGAYLLYAYTRIRSISRKSEFESKTVREKWVNEVEIHLEIPEERKLAKRILQWYDRIETLQEDLCPHILCDWLYDLAKTFTSYYDKYYVVEKRDGQTKVNKDRLLICEITAMIFEKAFHILGFLSVEKM